MASGDCVNIVHRLFIENLCCFFLEHVHWFGKKADEKLASLGE